jgi:hypothetical protein
MELKSQIRQEMKQAVNDAGVNDKNVKTQKKRWLGNLITGIVLVIIAVGILFIFKIKLTDKSAAANFSAVDKICELATLRCYYHDVAEYEKQPDGLFQYGLFQYGYKKFWIEYDGVVEIGIDVNEVLVQQPDKNGVVKIYIPEARILSVDADPYSMSDPIADTGVFTTITSEDKAEAFSAAQTAMRENAETDSRILLQAYNNAKELLKQYVIRVGEQTGEQYTVEWLDGTIIDNQLGGEQV